MVFVLLTACGTDYTIITRIFPDGSCERTMTVRVDSSKISGNPFYIPIDSSWTRETKMEHDSVKNKTFAIVSVSKKYASVEEMNKEFCRSDVLSEQPDVRMRLKKKFRWFHTQYRYEETYVQQFPFRTIPISSYLTNDEVQIIVF